MTLPFEWLSCCTASEMKIYFSFSLSMFFDLCWAVVCALGCHSYTPVLMRAIHLSVAMESRHHFSSKNLFLIQVFNWMPETCPLMCGCALKSSLKHRFSDWLCVCLCELKHILCSQTVKNIFQTQILSNNSSHSCLSFRICKFFANEKTFHLFLSLNNNKTFNHFWRHILLYNQSIIQNNSSVANR